MKIVLELPFYSKTVGGITATVELAKELKAEIRFQSVSRQIPDDDFPVPFTIGHADRNFPECDICITYSDNPYAEKLLILPQIKHVAVFMQSYGMSIANEKRNALNKRILTLCTTKKIEYLIKADGGIVHNVGMGLDIKGFTNRNEERKNYLAIMYHNMYSKRYETAVRVANMLYKDKVIDGVISFGMEEGYHNYYHPKGLVKHYPNATREEVASIFNQCKAFLMPSTSEGFNITPIEATLCGCPAVICDGAIGEIYIDEFNCFVVPKENIVSMYEHILDIVINFALYSESFNDNMNKMIEGYTWANVANKIKMFL